MEDYKLRTLSVSALFRLNGGNSGTYGKRLREVDIVLIEQLLTLEGERIRREPSGNPFQRDPTHPIEHISESTNSSYLFDERVAEDLVPLGVAVEVLRNRSCSQRKTPR
jgi:hypothetical protein